jgi:hypothetical protein
MIAADSSLVSCRRTSWQVYLVLAVLAGCAVHGILLRAELARVTSALLRCRCV